jgi:hypothetical protein
MEKIVWESEKKIIDKNFDYMIKNYYEKFEFKYNWNKNILVSDYLKRLFINSFMEDEKVRNDLPILIHDFETFIATAVNNDIINHDNILFVYRTLKNKLNSISFEDMNLLSKSKTNGIVLNKNLNMYLRSEKESSLAPDELRRLYLYKEISNKLINIDNDMFANKYISTIDKILYNKGISFDNKIDESLVKDGIIMMYEGISQNFAETILYKSLKMDRPKYKVTFNDRYPVVTNLEEKGVYQKPIISFGKTLAGINNKSDLETMLNMARVTLESSLTELIASEYNMGSKEKYYDLAKIYLNFGMIKRNNENPDQLLKLDITRVFALIDTITRRNINNNLLLMDEIKPINVDEYLTV